jgi:hypothetical protein
VADLHWGEVGRPPQLELGLHEHPPFFSGKFSSS